MSADAPIEASCHCGQVTLTAPRPPEAVTDCNCSICRRYGVLWAYYDPAEVVLPDAGATQSYEWGDRSIRFHRCRSCGCLSHWYPVDPARGRMGINARLFPLETLAGVRVRKLDGAVTERYLDES